MKFLKRVVFFFLRLINGVAVSAVKSLGVVSFLLTLLIIVILGAGYFVDRQLAGGYYAGYLMSNTMGGLNGRFWEFSYLTETYPLYCAVGVAAFFLLILLFKFRLRRGLIQRRRRFNILTNIAYVVLSTALNLMLIGASVALVLSGMLVSYLHAATAAGDEAQAGFWERAEFLQRQVNENRDLSSMALQKILYNLGKEPESVEALSDEAFMALCLEVNHLIDLQGGPRSSAEHYLRNRLNRAPGSLSEMVERIRSAREPAWVLLPPEQSAYHMQGRDGEYNLKFVSADGLFEAVYDKAGRLLTQDNDPVNMGTYNYADPVTQPKKHTTYDVLPYYQWGNTAQRGPVSAVEMQRVLAALERFSGNPEAEARYAQYRRLLGM